MPIEHGRYAVDPHFSMFKVCAALMANGKCTIADNTVKA
jgi:hypothetical protein